MWNNQNVLDSLLAASLREAEAGNGLEKWWRRWDEERGCVEKQAINRVQDRPRPQDRAKSRTGAPVLDGTSEFNTKWSQATNTGSV